MCVCVCVCVHLLAFIAYDTHGKISHTIYHKVVSFSFFLPFGLDLFFLSVELLLEEMKNICQCVYL